MRIRTLDDVRRLIARRRFRMNPELRQQVDKILRDAQISNASFWYKEKMNGRTVYRCSHCGRRSAAPTHFCPDCGMGKHKDAE